MKTPLFLVPGFLVTPDYALMDSQFLPHAQLVRSLGGDRPVYGLRTLGLGGRLQTYRSIGQMASEYAPLVQSVRPSGPYLLAGFCLGGLLAFEIARQLTAKSLPVELILVDTRCPTEQASIDLCIRYMDQYVICNRFSTNFKKKLDRALSILAKEKFNLYSLLLNIYKKSISSLIYEFSYEKYSLTQFNDEMAHLNGLASRYRPQTFGGKIHLVASRPFMQVEAQRGWDELATGGVDICRLPGSSTYASEYVQTIVEVIARADAGFDTDRRWEHRATV
jgi:thioesterase domain-containing protein